MYYSGGFWFLLAFSAPLFWSLPHKVRGALLSSVWFIYLLGLDQTGPILALMLGFAFYWILPRRDSRLVAARWMTTILIFLALGILAYFKYLPAADARFGFAPMPNIVLPLGISYFTFKLIHYAVEVRRGTIPHHRFGEFLGYLLHFPTFTMGPIERFDHYLKHREYNWRSEFVVDGMSRILHGLVKRFALADVLLPTMLGPMPTVGEFLEHLHEYHVAAAWWFLIRTYLYAYLEFSGYTDMAIGTSRFFGVRIMENFRFPILATNISDFWQRWHMTLTGWCQSYVYMPLLGLTRNPYLATYGAFATMGLWHAGAMQWLSWGLWHSSGIAVYVSWRRTKFRRRWVGGGNRVTTFVGWTITQLFVTAGYSFTCTYPNHTFGDSVRILAALFTPFS